MNSTTYQSWAQVETINVVDSVNNYLSICHENLNQEPSILDLQSKLQNELCDINSSIIYYEVSEQLGIDSIQERCLANRILEINEQYFKNGTPLFLYSKGGVFSFDKVSQGQYEILKITTPHSCISNEMDEKRKSIYALINENSNQLLSQ